MKITFMSLNILPLSSLLAILSLTENKKKKHHWQEATSDTMVQLKTSPELTKTWD